METEVSMNVQAPIKIFEELGKSPITSAVNSVFYNLKF